MTQVKVGRGPNTHTHRQRGKTHLLILPEPLDGLSLALFLLNILVGQAVIPQKSLVLVLVLVLRLPV